MGTVIAISNQKGGVGKTTTALELAVILNAEHKKKVLLIDFDQQLSTTLNYNLGTKNTIMNIFSEECTIKDAIQHTKYFDAIPGDEGMSRADKIYLDRDDIYLLADVCEVLKELYDYIIIDNSPALNMALNMAYVAADYIIVPVDATPDALKGLTSVYKDVEKLKNTREKASHAEILGIILIAYEKANVVDDVYEELSNMAANIGSDVFVDKTRKSVKSKEVKFSKKTLYELSKYCNPSIDYKRIANSIISKVEGK